jgi:hypothetical protein
MHDMYHHLFVRLCRYPLDVGSLHMFNLNIMTRPVWVPMPVPSIVKLLPPVNKSFQPTLPHLGLANAQYGRCAPAPARLSGTCFYIGNLRSGSQARSTSRDRCSFAHTWDHGHIVSNPSVKSIIIFELRQDCSQSARMTMQLVRLQLLFASRHAAPTCSSCG